MDQDAFEVFARGDEQDIRSAYALYAPSFVSYLRNAFHCPPSKAEEVYPEAFCILYFNIKNGKLTAPLQSSIQTYLNSTGWHLYHRRHLTKYDRDKISLDTIEHPSQTSTLVDEALIQRDRADHLRKLLDQIGEPCREILMQIYFHETPYKDLAIKMDLNEGALRKRKFDCLGKIRKLYYDLNLEL